MTNEFERDVLEQDALCSVCTRRLPKGAEVWFQASRDAHWDPNGYGDWYPLCDDDYAAKMNGELE